MLTNKRKLPAMHEVYGKSPQHKCRDCCNLTRIVTVGGVRRKVYLKCKAYGDSGGEATDWGLNFMACGLYNIPFIEEITLLERINNERT